MTRDEAMQLRKGQLLRVVSAYGKGSQLAEVLADGVTGAGRVRIRKHSGTARRRWGQPCTIHPTEILGRIEPRDAYALR